jgi:hypothetical protein
MYDEDIQTININKIICDYLTKNNILHTKDHYIGRSKFWADHLIINSEKYEITITQYLSGYKTKDYKIDIISNTEVKLYVREYNGRILYGICRKIIDDQFRITLSLDAKQNNYIEIKDMIYTKLNNLGVK